VASRMSDLDRRLLALYPNAKASIAATAALCMIMGLVAVLPVQNDTALPLVVDDLPSETPTPSVLPSTEPAVMPSMSEPAPIVPAPQAAAQPAPTQSAAAPESLVVAEAGPRTRSEADPPATKAKPPAADDTARDRFEQRFPEHAAATQDPDDPGTLRWAVLIGINKHAGTTRDNLGSRQDAEALAAHLRGLGWRDDHVLLLTDAMATRENIVEAIRWLQRKTDSSSVSVFHYSGHTKQWPGWDVDGDGETTDEALWPSDNRHISDGEWAALMAPIPGRMWINIGACEAAGYLDPGVAGPGRIVTFSSAEDEKSYEDPSVGHSVWGYELVINGLRREHADHDGDGTVTVEEAVNFAIPRAATRTQNQRYGQQSGGVDDRVDGDFRLDIPAPPQPAPSPEPSPTPSTEPCQGICLPGVPD
jgi:hypothetical protein